MLNTTAFRRLVLTGALAGLSACAPYVAVRTDSAPDTSVGIMQLLYRINMAGTTILMVTHDREMVDKMRKRVIQLEDGRLSRDERRGGYTGE